LTIGFVRDCRSNERPCDGSQSLIAAPAKFVADNAADDATCNDITAIVTMDMPHDRFSNFAMTAMLFRYGNANTLVDRFNMYNPGIGVMVAAVVVVPILVVPVRIMTITAIVSISVTRQDRGRKSQHQNSRRSNEYVFGVFHRASFTVIYINIFHPALWGKRAKG
jgi:hypothetical protein